MTQLFEFMFMDIWHFLGCLLVIQDGCSGIAAILEATAKIIHKPKVTGPTERELNAFRAGMEAVRDTKFDKAMKERAR